MEKVISKKISKVLILVVAFCLVFTIGLSGAFAAPLPKAKTLSNKTPVYKSTNLKSKYGTVQKNASVPIMQVNVKKGWYKVKISGKAYYMQDKTLKFTPIGKYKTTSACKTYLNANTKQSVSKLKKSATVNLIAKNVAKGWHLVASGSGVAYIQSKFLNLTNAATSMDAGTSNTGNAGNTANTSNGTTGSTGSSGNEMAFDAGVAGRQSVAGVAPYLETATADRGYIVGGMSDNGGYRTYGYFTKDGKSSNPEFKATGNPVNFLLPMGMGTYNATLVQSINGSTQVRLLFPFKMFNGGAETIELYKMPNSEVDYDASTLFVRQAQGLVSGRTTDEAKFKAMYEWLVKNYNYDYPKANSIQPGYMVDLDAMYKAKKGVCIDFAIELAAMARSQGIPIKVAKGKCKIVDNYGTYHAWNEVYISGQWRIVDSSSDACFREAGAKYNMYKDASEYNPTSYT